MRDSSIEQQGVGAGLPDVRLAPQFAVASPRASHMVLPSHHCGGNSWWPRAVFSHFQSTIRSSIVSRSRSSAPSDQFSDFDPTILAAPADPIDHGKPKGRAP